MAVDVGMADAAKAKSAKDVQADPKMATTMGTKLSANVAAKKDWAGVLKGKTVSVDAKSVAVSAPTAASSSSTTSSGATALVSGMAVALVWMSLM